MIRPRRWPPGSTAADRVRAADEALRAAGGKRLNVRLSPEAVEAIALAREVYGDRTDAEVIDRALVREGKRAARAKGK